MATFVEGQPLARRLIGRYLMFGLAGVLACIVLALLFSLRGTLPESVAWTAAVPVALLTLGACVLYRTVRVNEAVEQQLSSLAAVGSPGNATLTPLCEADAVAAGWNKLVRQVNDDTVLAKLEARLRELGGAASSSHWSTIFNALSDGMAVCDQENDIQEANSSLAALTGFNSSQELAGRSITDLLQGLAGPERRDKVGIALRREGLHVSELQKSDDLADGVLRISRTPVVNDGGESSGWLWTVRDITQQKLADEMRNQFVQTATHELRTPLANIKAYAETLTDIDDIDVDKQKGFYNIINAEASRLSRFVDELLNISQMEAGAVSIVRRETDLERLLGEVVSSSQPLAESKNLLFESSLPAKLPKISLDKDKFTAALVNLLSNAVKYTPEHGTVRLVVEVDESHIHFHVDDTGIGISKDELPRMCEKFFRSQDSRVQEITGSGLGLAFSQEVARLHGGQITVASELNKGSRFTLILPLK